jgi:hypothetical protein
VTALVPSDTACLASSPGRIRRTCGGLESGLRVDGSLFKSMLEMTGAHTHGRALAVSSQAMY